jgi:hypothetical protein
MTSLSLFVPLIATIAAFVLLGDEEDIIDADDHALRALFNPGAWLRSWRVILAGVIMGLTSTWNISKAADKAVGLMHYSASFQLPYLIVSYTVSPLILDFLTLQAVTVVFALILACVAATAALALFFRARVQWQDSWWKRGLCSIFLATAVCG